MISDEYAGSTCSYDLDLDKFIKQFYGGKARTTYIMTRMH